MSWWSKYYGSSDKQREASERFWGKVSKGTGCWSWVGFMTKQGYGRHHVGGHVGVRLYAHRISWELRNGQIPDSLCVLHKCDNPRCVNPDHLFLGTKADNSRDMVCKGRHRTIPLKGERNGSSRLTEAQVLSIRSRWPAKTKAALAAEYGVSATNISYIITRKKWAHI